MRKTVHYKHFDPKNQKKFPRKSEMSKPQSAPYIMNSIITNQREETLVLGLRDTVPCWSNQQLITC